MGEYEKNLSELALRVMEFSESHPEKILGPHPIGAGSYIVRAYLPRAKEAWIEDNLGKIIGKMENTINDPLFECTLDYEYVSQPYLICFRDSTGYLERRYDPYFFKPKTGDFEIYLFKKGELQEAWETFGAHMESRDGIEGTRFTAWAPNASSISVIGNFNHWIHGAHPMTNLKDSGVWEIFIPGVHEGEVYKYAIRSSLDSLVREKTDPFAFRTELRPNTGSIVTTLEYRWKHKSIRKRTAKDGKYSSPMSVYEVHAGSWRKSSDGSRIFPDFRELAEKLIPYVKEMGFTHIEFLPLMEHPFDGSWGYQTVNYYSPTSRYGKPEDLMFFIDMCHKEGIGVILDWVPAHFPDDDYGLSLFDGTHLFDHADPRLGFHPDWGTRIFNYARNEVRNFLISSALFWLEKYHADGIRIDAVSSMLYLDYSRKEGEWIPNRYGGRENLDAIEFIKNLNDTIHRRTPDSITVAEESTAWGGVTRPTSEGGLGFDFKWNMGWMHDTLYYFSKDPIYRKYEHGILPFTIWYAFSERYILPFSHDEVVHMKGSLLNKMPGDRWQKFANLRACIGFMFASPGKKLLFMGSEIGQETEWSESSELQWGALSDSFNANLKSMVRDLNHLYIHESALHELDTEPSGFRWIDFNDSSQSVISFIRMDKTGKSLIFVFNLTPIPRHNYSIGVPDAGQYEEIFNTDSSEYGGSNVRNENALGTKEQPMHGMNCSIEITLPPLSMIILRRIVR